MKSKVLFITLIFLFFGILFCVESCKNDFLYERQTSININLDLSKILKETRNLAKQISSEFILRLVVYDAATYKTDSIIENLPVLAQVSNKVDTSGIVKTTVEVPIDANVIFEAKLFQIDETTQQESLEALYYGKSEITTILPQNNKIHLILTKTQPDVDVEVEVSIFSIEFESLGGDSVKKQEVEKDKTATEPTSPTKTGYTFDGWYTSSDEGTTLETEYDFTAPITSDITLYAKWIANTYSVTFDKNAQNATGTMENQNFTYDKETTLLSNSFSNPGYRFSVWNTKADGSGEVYNNNQSVKNLTSEKDGTITLYAQWTLEGNYLITYNLNEGTNNPNNPLEYNVESATIVLQAPTKEGYIFEGWENEFGNVITEITKGSTGDITLTAQWTPRTDISYTVEHYKQNVEDENYTLSDTENKKGTTDTKTSSTAKAYEGFTAKEFEERTILADGTTVVEIYYDRKSYTVSFDSKAENPESYESQTLKYEQTATEPIFPTKTGYTFDGWYTSSDEGTTLETEYDFTAPITSDITLYAKWIANTYSVTFDKNAQNATGTMENQNFTYDKETTLLSNSFSNPGYRFSVWNTKADGSGEVYNNNQSVKNLTSEKDGTITLYAQWTLEGNYLITYNLNEGTNNPNNPLEYNVESATIVLQAPTKEGYIFEGWENEFGNVITEITKGSTGDITLTAQWTPRTDISYTVEHYKQNVEDENYTLSDTENKKGTTDTKTSSTAKAYEGFTAKEFEERTILADGTTVVEIYYDRKSYTVSFDSKAENPESYESQTLKYEQTATEPIFPTKTGYTFDGWYTSSDEGTTLETEFDFTAPITSDITLYAKWLELYTITYELNGGENKTNNPASYNVETETITLAEPTKTGYTFDGWYTDASLTIKKIEITKGSTGDIKLYAKWIANKSTITITLPDTNDIDIELQQAMNGEKVTFTANDGFASYAWYIDGEKQVNVTGETFEVDTSSRTAANYTVMVIVTDYAGYSYSATAFLELKK